MTLIFAKIRGWLAVAGAALTILVGVYIHGRSQGKADARLRQSEDNLKASRKAREIEDNVGKLDKVDVDKRLSRWMRDR